MVRLLLNVALLLLMLAGLSLLTGCATAPTAPQIVQVPVRVPCPQASPLVRPSRPALAAPSVPKSASPSTKAEALDDDLERLQGYAKNLETLLDGCNK